MDIKPYIKKIEPIIAPYKQQLMQRWKAFSNREQYIVVLLAIFVVATLLYKIIFSPLLAGVKSSRAEVIRQQELLVYMESAAPRIEQARAEVKPVENISSDLFLPTVEATLSQASLMQNVVEISLSETQNVNIQFKDVDFDSLLLWLVNLRQKYGIHVSQLTAVPAELPGVSNVTLQLEL